MTVRLVPGLVGLRALEEPWWDLWRRDPDATPFHSPAWLLPWAETFQPETALAVVACRDGRLDALLPLFRFEGRLIALGAGITDHCGPLLDPGFDRLDELLAVVGGEGMPIDLPDLRGPLLEHPVPAGWAEERWSCEPWPVLPLPATFSRSHRQNIRTSRNRAERLGPVTVERVAGTAVLAALEELTALHGARWRTRGEEGVLADGAVAAFHALAAPALDRAGLLRLWRLRVGERPAALQYGISAKRRFHYYLGGFDPDLSHVSPGALLLAHGIAEATADGCAEFDFLRGAEPYKYCWGAVDRPGWGRRLLPSDASPRTTIDAAPPGSR
ncbi:MAG TPA: GNAT family N-acetyltransferase [Azospirillaceae bacterium]|nr:GNAT family N-acetyltransferase [Azospirillaceae bacterium]